MSVQRLYRFIFVGIINTIFGTSVMFCLYNFLGCSYWISSAANYIFGSILSYILNKRFTFRHKGGVMASGVKFAVNIVVCYFIAYGAAKPAVAWLAVGASVNMRENIATVSYTHLDVYKRQILYYTDGIYNIGMGFR